MKTYSESEYKKKYGEIGLAQLSEPTQPEEKGYLGRVIEQVKGNVHEASQSLDASRAGTMNPLRAGVNIAKNASSAVLAPVSQAPGFKQLGEGFNKAGQAIVDTKAGNKVTDALANNFSPETLGTAADTVETGLNVAGIEGTIAGAKSGFTKTKSAYNKITEPTPSGGSSSIPDPQVTLKTAIQDATPDYESANPTRQTKLLDRVQEGGILQGGKVTPNALEIEAGTELSKVPGYDPKSTKLAKYKVTKAEIANRAKTLRESLKNEKVVVPKREVTSFVSKAVNDLPNRSLILQSADPVIANYMRVFKNAFKKLPGTLEGILDLKQTLDDAYENARGKQAFGSDKISALDDINKVSRDALTDYMIKKARNTDVKTGLRSQWNLYRALDELKIMAQKEPRSQFGRLKQKYPLTTKGVRAAGRMIGVGQAVDLFH